MNYPIFLLSVRKNGSTNPKNNPIYNAARKAELKVNFDVKMSQVIYDKKAIIIAELDKMGYDCFTQENFYGKVFVKFITKNVTCK